MTPEAIARFIEAEKVQNGQHMRIDLKKRNSIFGMLIQGKDYEDLKTKNFWRIVTSANLAAWKKTGNLEFAKIYSGAEFNKISVVDEAVVA
jgi:IS4 transposase